MQNKKITNLAPGSEPNDAITYSQLQNITKTTDLSHVATNMDMGIHKITHLGNADEYMDAINLWQTRFEIEKHNEICCKTGYISMTRGITAYRLLTINMNIIVNRTRTRTFTYNIILFCLFMVTGIVTEVDERGGVTTLGVYIQEHFVISGRSVNFMYAAKYAEYLAVSYVLFYIKVNKDVIEV